MSSVFYTKKEAYLNLVEELENYISNDTAIVCIGTDRAIGDCLGPMVGTMLKEKKFPLDVYGTIEKPIHALNINEQMEKIKVKHNPFNIIGIDACLGDEDEIGLLKVRDYGIRPGMGVGKHIQKVGNASIIGVVDISNSAESFVNRNIRLNLIYEMAKVIVKSLFEAYKAHSNNKIDKEFDLVYSR